MLATIGRRLRISICLLLFVLIIFVEAVWEAARAFRHDLMLAWRDVRRDW